MRGSGFISVKEQGKRKLEEMFAHGKGTSKHADKCGGNTTDKIYSDVTLHTYKLGWERYIDSMRKDDFKVDGHRPRSFEETARYMPQYIEKLKSSPGKSAGQLMSAYTIHTYFSGPAKILGLRSSDYDLPIRHLSDIARSRGRKKSDNRFSETNNAELVAFCMATGLRKNKELQKIKGTALIETDDGYAIHVVGKGGRVRDVPIIGTDAEIQAVVNRMRSAGSESVWTHVPSQADIHSYRAVYARRVYDKYARPIDTLPKSEIYRCRSDSSEAFDKSAVLMASLAIGHTRLNVTAEHYLSRGAGS